VLRFGVPQGSVIGPKGFIEYAEDVDGVFEKQQLHHHLFTDDMQRLASGSLSSVPVIASTLPSCFADVGTWCASKRLQLNASKTEVMWFGTANGLRKLPTVSGRIYAGIEIVKPVLVVRNLGVLIDAELTMRDKISKTCQSCFFHLRRLRSIRKLLGQDVTIQLVCALVLSRLDYCNSVYAGLPDTTLAPLQRVLHAAARLVNDLKTSDHVISALMDLHWLPIK
jgi:Reverse transcriptase (RNA-dependent DNA polymerase)